jgi:hypothetical protein
MNGPKIIRTVQRCIGYSIFIIVALEKLEWSGLKQPHIWDLITKSVRDAHSVKFFLAYDRPWWRSSHNYDEYAVSDTPLHRTYDFGTIHGSNVSVLNAVYTDNDVTLLQNDKDLELNALEATYTSS